jgi:hypothetical protein
MKCQRVLNTLHWRLSMSPEVASLLTPIRCLAVAGLAVLLQACVATPATKAPVAAAPAPAIAPPAAATAAPAQSAEQPAEQPAEPKAPVGELTLHLPEPQSASCNCSDQPKETPSFLDKGFTALAARDYREAVNYFRRYQRLESSPGSDWEASIAVAYVKMIPESPYYNWRAARDSYLRLMREPPQGVTLHERIVLYKDTLAILIDLHTQINDLQSQSAALSEALEKREEALRRLRELTLGQKGAGQ